MSLARGVTAFYGGKLFEILLSAENMEDFLGLQDTPEIKKLLSTNGDKTIVFTDLVKKVNRKNKVIFSYEEVDWHFQIQERVLLVSDQAIYNLEKLKKPKKGSLYDFKRRIPFKLIDSVSLSKLSDNYFVIHVPSEYDYVYEVEIFIHTILTNMI